MGSKTLTAAMLLIFFSMLTRAILPVPFNGLAQVVSSFSDFTATTSAPANIRTGTAHADPVVCERYHGNSGKHGICIRMLDLVSDACPYQDAIASILSTQTIVATPKEWGDPRWRCEEFLHNLDHFGACLEILDAWRNRCHTCGTRELHTQLTDVMSTLRTASATRTTVDVPGYKTIAPDTIRALKNILSFDPYYLAKLAEVYGSNKTVEDGVPAVVKKTSYVNKRAIEWAAGQPKIDDFDPTLTDPEVDDLDCRNANYFLRDAEFLTFALRVCAACFFVSTAVVVFFVADMGKRSYKTAIAAVLWPALWVLPAMLLRKIATQHLCKGVSRASMAGPYSLWTILSIAPLICCTVGCIILWHASKEWRSSRPSFRGVHAWRRWRWSTPAALACLNS